MNIPFSNIRGFFEILMPGIFLVINVSATAFLIATSVSPELIQSIAPSLKYLENSAIAMLLLTVVGYPIGVVLRLLKNARIDSLSAKYIKRRCPEKSGKLYLNEEFFYGKWMHKKCNSRLPAEAARFYEEYWGDKDTGNGIKNTSFFNFCKTIIAKHDPQSANEIYTAEALCRFVAGSYYALQVSVVLMLLNAVCIFKICSIQATLLPVLFLFGYLYLIHVILLQYRILRCKEVDSVFNACFANREHFDSLFPSHASRLLMKPSQHDEYDNRKELLLGAWSEKWKNDRLIQSLDIQKLLYEMKNQSKNHPYLSSLYFAGSDVDHPFFLENSQISLGLAVLPEDSPKSSKAKQHPHQTEVIIVIQGTLCLYHEYHSEMKKEILKANDHYIIPKGICHYISCSDDENAVYLFIKTNSSKEPRGLQC